MHAYTSVSSPVESHGCRVVSVNIMPDGSRALLLCVCLSAPDVFDVIVWGLAAGVSVRPDVWTLAIPFLGLLPMR